MIGQLLTLPRWIQIVLARIKGLGVLQGAGEKLPVFQRKNSVICHLKCAHFDCVYLENTAETGKEEPWLLEDTQTDFRSILSFGVQPP